MESKKVYLTLRYSKENDYRESLDEKCKTIYMEFVDEPVKVPRVQLLNQYDSMCARLKEELKRWLENE